MIHRRLFSPPGDDIRFASYYGDHMVLQKAPEKAVLWGYGPKNVSVVVTLSGLSKRKTYSSTVFDGELRSFIALTPHSPWFGPSKATHAVYFFWQTTHIAY